MKHKFKNLRKFTLLAIITQIVFITSCNSDGPIMEQPEQIYYDLAQRRMNANNYFSAIEALQAIETNYPFGRRRRWTAPADQLDTLIQIIIQNWMELEPSALKK